MIPFHNFNNLLGLDTSGSFDENEIAAADCSAQPLPSRHCLFEEDCAIVRITLFSCRLNQPARLSLDSQNEIEFGLGGGLAAILMELNAAGAKLQHFSSDQDLSFLDRHLPQKLDHGIEGGRIRIV